MSVVIIRSILETALDAITPSIATAFENVSYQPPSATIPYQIAWVIFATPDNPETGAGYRELGFMQVTLQYPLQAGTSAAAARAILIRETFKKNTSLSNSGVVVTINKTPAIGNGVVDTDRWAVPVKIPFHANFF